MVTLYVMSTESFAGKTVVCLGLARKMAESGLSVGYIRPVTTPAKQLEATKSCAPAMVQGLGLTEPMDVLCPVFIDSETVEEILSGNIEDMRQKVTDAFGVASKGRDVMVVEGVSGFFEGTMVGLDPSTTIDMLGARALLVMRGANESMVDTILGAKKLLGDRLLGVVFNSVPQGMLGFAEETLAPFLNRNGIKVYAVFPEDRMLMSVSIAELVDKLGGRVIAGQNHLDHTVSSVMIGAMSVENALTYFRRRPNKVVITGGDRPDIQVAALETSTRCLILTGNFHPDPMILGKAEELGVPVVLVQQDTLAAVELVEQVFSQVQFHQEPKIRRFERMMEEHFGFAELQQDLGLR